MARLWRGGGSTAILDAKTGTISLGPFPKSALRLTFRKLPVVPPNRIAFLIAALMFAASLGAVVVRPSAKLSDERKISLEAMVPKQFGDWREQPELFAQVVNPQTQELLDKLYSQILARTYVNSSGYRIMVSLAYGSDQRGSLQAHKPEVCYPAQGFTLQKNEAGQLVTSYGDIPVRRLFTTMGARKEPVTYWFTVGDQAVMGTTQKKLVELRFGLTGRIPDGMLFRVSSLDGDLPRAYQMQEQFVKQLLQTVPSADRKRLSGLGDS
jgi:EpsI family protein